MTSIFSLRQLDYSPLISMHDSGTRNLEHISNNLIIVKYHLICTFLNAEDSNKGDARLKDNRDF